MPRSVARIVMRVLAKVVAVSSRMSRRKGRRIVASLAASGSAAAAAGVGGQQGLRGLSASGHDASFVIEVVLALIELVVAGVHGEPAGEREQEEKDDAAHQDSRCDVQLKLSG